MDFEMPSCGGCRTCEMACSFKHRQRYQPSISSLKIFEREHFRGYTVSLAEAASGAQLPCDGCVERRVPLCMEFCPKREDLRAILDRFLRDRSAAARAR